MLTRVPCFFIIFVPDETVEKCACKAEKGDAVTKADIVNQIAEATGLTKTDTSLVVEGMLSSLIAAMQNGEHVEIRGFGTFKIVRRAPRTGRNPKTGKIVKIPARVMPVFKPSRELRHSVAEAAVLPSR